jgi:hypothetical protein
MESPNLWKHDSEEGVVIFTIASKRVLLPSHLESPPMFDNLVVLKKIAQPFLLEESCLENIQKCLEEAL